MIRRVVDWATESPEHSPLARNRGGLCTRVIRSFRLAMPHLRHSRKTGFTLVDVMIAATILVVAFIGMIEAVTISSNMMESARRQAMAAQIIDNEIELLRLQSWATISGLPVGPSVTTWSTVTAYVSGDLVSTKGSWYRCILANTNKTPPNATYWVPYMSWSSSSAYVVPDLVSYNATWYRCILANTNQAPPNATYWSTYAGPIASTGTSSGATFSISRSVSDVVAGNLREAVFTVTWGVTTSRRNSDGTALAFSYTSINSAYYGKYGLQLSYQRQ